MVIDPTDPKVMYANDGYGKQGVFKSTNGGVDWVQAFTPEVIGVFIDNGFTERIAMDPTDHLHLTVSPHFNCQNGHASTCILETKDGAKSWNVIENGGPSEEAYSEEMVDSTTWLWASPSSGLFRTTDSGMTWNKVSGIGSAYAGRYGDCFYKSKAGVYYMGSQGGILRSKDAISWSVVPNTPITNSISSDGVHIYASFGFPGFQAHYVMTDENDGTTWKSVSTPMGMRTGAWAIIADPVNQFLYSSNGGAGVWRLSTK